MSGNSFGKIFKITTFGESHGEAIGVVVDGCPSGIALSEKDIQAELNRRKPGALVGDKKNIATTSRKETDEAQILSGVFNGFTTGTPISIVIKNTSQNSNDYDNLKNTYRPGHADFTYEVKYGHRDYRGGGRASGRETASRVAAGAIAKKILSTFGTKTIAYTIKAAGITCEKRDLTVIEKNMIRACDFDAAKKMEEKIASLREHGDSSGGIIECVVQGIPHSLGEPVFDKLDALLAHALLSIGAIKGIEFGLGFEAADNLGSQNNDSPYVKDGNVQFLSNNDGGITGGISSGNDIVFRVAVKPVPSIFKTQNTIQKNDDGTFSNTTLAIKGRHDVCLCPRIVPVVEAMTNIVLVDMLLQNKCVRL